MQVPQQPEDGVGLSEAGAIGYCELSGLGDGT